MEGRRSTTALLGNKLRRLTKNNTEVDGAPSQREWSTSTTQKRRRPVENRKSRIVSEGRSRTEAKKARLSQVSSASASKARLALLEGRDRALTDVSGLPLFGLRKVIIDVVRQEHRRVSTSNAITTEAFRWWSFIPVALYRQLYDLPLLWHFVMSGVNVLLPPRLRMSHYYLGLPTLVVLSVGIFGEALHFFMRHRHHQKQNKRQVLMLHASTCDLRPVSWAHIQVGDIVCVRQNEEAPCDLVILSTADAEGAAYADVTGWLGMTSWQNKQAVKETRGETTVSALSSLVGTVICSHPTISTSLSRRLMDDFTGSLKLRGYPRASPLSSANFFVKGSKLRGVDFMFGIAVYVGNDSYIHRWSTRNERKRSILAKKTDKFALLILLFLFIAVMIDLIVPRIHQGFGQYWEHWPPDTAYSTGIVSAASLMRYAQLVPLASLPTIALYRIIQARRIAKDEELGAIIKNEYREAKVYNYDVLENLGSVDVCFVNKTGTLTTGQLQFLGCTIGGKDFGALRRGKSTSEASLPGEAIPASGDRAATAGTDELLDNDDFETPSDSLNESSGEPLQSSNATTTPANIQPSRNTNDRPRNVSTEVLAKTVEARRQQRLEQDGRRTARKTDSRSPLSPSERLGAPRSFKSPASSFRESSALDSSLPDSSRRDPNGSPIHGSSDFRRTAKASRLPVLEERGPFSDFNERPNKMTRTENKPIFLTRPRLPSPQARLPTPLLQARTPSPTRQLRTPSTSPASAQPHAFSSTVLQPQARHGSARHGSSFRNLTHLLRHSSSRHHSHRSAHRMSKSPPRLIAAPNDPLQSLSLEQIFPTRKTVDSGGDASLVYSPPSGVAYGLSSLSESHRRSDSAQSRQSLLGQWCRPISPVEGAPPPSDSPHLSAGDALDEEGAYSEGSSSSASPGGRARIVKHTSSASRKPAFVPLLVGLAGELEPAHVAAPASSPLVSAEEEPRAHHGMHRHISAVAGDTPSGGTRSSKVSSSRGFNLPPAAPGLLDQQYMPPMLQLPRAFREDLHENILSRARNFVDSTVLDDLRASERRYKLTLHFLRCLALCHRAVPYFVTESLDLFATESVRLARGLKESKPSETATLPTDTGERRGRSTVHTTSIVTETPDSQKLERNAQSRLSAPDTIVGSPRGDLPISEQPRSGSTKSLRAGGAPYLSALRWELNSHIVRELSMKPVRQASTKQKHVVREEPWEPELIDRLRFRASSSEEAACVCTSAKCGFAIISRTSDYADLDIVGQMRRFELLSGQSTSGSQGFTSIVCREESEYSAILYAKGPDRAVLPLLDMRSKQKRNLRRRIRQNTRQGFRSVLLAFRQLTRAETREFRKVWEESKDSIYKKSDRMERALQKYQTKLKVLGMVLLQEEPMEGTIESIKILREAGVAVWVMTGDHGDFAVQAAAAVGLSHPEGKVFHVAEVWKRIHNRRGSSQFGASKSVSLEATLEKTMTEVSERKDQRRAVAAIGNAEGSSGGELRRELLELFAEFKRVRRKAGDMGVCVVLSGKIVQTLLANLEMQTIFLLLTCEATCVICCRLAPAQKAIVLITLRRCLSPSPVIMAIGSGLGDNLMVRVASVGVVVWKTWQCAKGQDDFSGVELLEACDICVSSIASVPTLLVAHGADILERNARVVFWILFRTCLCVWPVLWINCFSDFSNVSAYSNDWDMTLIIYLWTFFIPFGAMIFQAPPNIMSTRTATLMYNTSRGRWSVRHMSALVVLTEGLLVSFIAVLLILFIGDQPGMDQKGKIRTLSDRTLLVTVVALAHLRFFYTEHESPLDSEGKVFLACGVAALPALLWMIIVVIMQGRTYEVFTHVPSVFALSAIIGLSFLIHTVFCIIMRKMTPIRLVLAYTQKCLRQNKELELQNADMAPLLSDSFSTPGYTGSGLSRLSVVFSLVNRLIPYTVVLFASSQALNSRHSSFIPLSSSAASTMSTHSEGGETEGQAKVEETSSGPWRPDPPAFARDGVRHKSYTSDRDEDLDQPLEPGDFIDDIVSVASFTEAESSLGIAPDLFDSESEEKAFGRGARELDEEDSDPDQQPEELGGGDSEDEADAAEVVPLFKRDPSMDERKRANIQAGLHATAEVRGTTGGDHKQVQADDLIDNKKVKFKDQQLENEYSANNVKERQQFAIIFQIFFGLVVFLTGMEIFFKFDLVGEPWWQYPGPVLRGVTSLIGFVGSFFRASYDHFDKARLIYSAVFIVTYFPARLSFTPPVYSLPVFAVWTLIISRMPFRTAMGYNALFFLLNTVGDILGKYASWTGVIFEAVFNGGSFSFIALAGHRLDLALRRRFLMNYQVEVSRRKQREILTTMLPTFVVEQMLTSSLNADGIPENLKAENPGIVTVIFCDVFQFQNLVSTLEATRLVELLDNLFLFYDKCADQFKVTKIETVFETYLSCAGIQPGSDKQSDDPQRDAFDAIDMGLAMLEVTSYTRYEVSRSPDDVAELPVPEPDHDGEEVSGDNATIIKRLRVKIGIHTGSVTSGVVGAKKPQYALFGDTVNTASRMKLTGEPDHIHVSDATHEYLRSDQTLHWQPRQLEVKGKGLMKTYLLVKVTGTTYPNFGTTTALQSERSLNTDSSNATTPFRLPTGRSPSRSPRFQRDYMMSRVPPFSRFNTTSQETLISSENTVSSHDVKPLVQRLFDREHSPKLSLFEKLRILDFQQNSGLSDFVFHMEHTVGSSKAPSSMERGSPRVESASKSNRDLLPAKETERNLSPRNLRSGESVISDKRSTGISLQRANRHRNERAVNIADDVEELATSSFDITRFKEKLSFAFLQFRDPAVEDRYSKYMKGEGVYLLAVQYSLIIFMMVLTISTVARVVTNDIKTIGQTRHQDPMTTDLEGHGSLELAFWWIRAIELTAAFSVWLLFLSLSKQDRSGWAMHLASFLFIGSTVVFVLTPTQTAGASQMSWKWFFDSTEMAFCFVILHHNNGLTFAKLVLVDILIVVLISVFLTVVIEISLDAKVTLAVFPPIFLIFLFSAYVKELLNRVTWVVNQDFQSTEDRARELLADMLPKQVLEEFQQDRLKLAYHHDQISFLFADIVGFTSYAKTVEPTQVVKLLQKLFARFDRDTSRLGLYKLCTIGDAYVAVSEPNTEETEDYDPVPGAEKIWEMSQLMLGNIRDVGIEADVPHLNMRIGLHFGSCVGGVIGTGRLRYDFWGMDVLTGNSMESAGAPGKINVSKAYKEFMERAFAGRFEFEKNKVVLVLHLSVESFFMLEPRLLVSPSGESVKPKASARRGPKRRISMLGYKAGTAVAGQAGRSDKTSASSMMDPANVKARSRSRTIKAAAPDMANLERLRQMYNQSQEKLARSQSRRSVDVPP
eukprot:Gregarina_sp_Poly_1__916@NODE_121_length_13560_cov_302_880679_g108_i0_p1_GENE_NODE_121_length_13560_cov_302_880679_g108_i0NODE_121_length_13560_cov_302_880679_g108_i0_p1_ORF_typecomplete_len3331_score470_09Guanylate_cyc/PF00211_20/2_4e42Guanylate_cyc/PF00211_20/6_1e38Hydrolase/PF00702_26/0_19Hydrolase/PF00702_26/1e11E1E2_ATPase/PF00122_20/5_3e14E1E2_ATPase/PF00122_20/8_4e03E1E2_ATPase/PF00122_20/7_5e03E1E2_ATPase/PF00122_20/8_6e03PhoLip_ATPase_C/PF16212_5/1_6e08PhoLip_ATPase_C/PF16212_5/1_8e04HA